MFRQMLFSKVVPALKKMDLLTPRQRERFAKLGILQFEDWADPFEALADTASFLGRPERWDKNGVDAVFSDKKLARLQFAHALGACVSTGVVADRRPLLDAARRLVRDQADDGSWKIDDNALIGSPATYGTALSTAVARLTYRYDGREYRDVDPVSGMPKSNTLAFTSLDRRTVEVVHRVGNPPVTYREIRRVAEDGRTLTFSATLPRRDGTVTVLQVFDRQ